MVEPPPAEGPSRDELFDLYKIAVDEYRFQVQLNWNRAQYLLVFNVGIVSVGTGISKLGHPGATPLVEGLFAVGVLSAMMSAAAMRLQQGYDACYA